MTFRLTMPALGESVTEGTVTRWLKNVGDYVEAEETILEVATDKVDSEVPAPISGIITEIRLYSVPVAVSEQIFSAISYA